ncbi:protein kinase, putative [Bodo saltans]|uniref:Protein kinase, putative n=1 Tax=Bodo saltans TaxID=75058 RepID=A0A0S4IHT0_BODSA|nr:protein kinase, putative [Bodo saltans]|eukprot:CUE68709.1 protein kinase, putative [Bodo saltans]
MEPCVAIVPYGNRALVPVGRDDEDDESREENERRRRNGHSTSRDEEEDEPLFVNTGALVPIAGDVTGGSRMSSLWCPMCRRPFAPTLHGRDGSAEEEESERRGDSAFGRLGRTQSDDGLFDRIALLEAGGLLTSQYFRSLPPVQEDGTESPIPGVASPVSRNATKALCSPSYDKSSGPVDDRDDPPFPAPPIDDRDALCRRLAAEGYYARHFEEVHRIGGGTFGAVFLCRHVIEGQTLGLFAVKKIPIGDDPDYFCQVLREVRVMEEIKRHPNVLEYHHSWIDYAKTADFGPHVRCLFVLMEFASVGSLEDYLRVHGSSLSNMAVWYFFLSAVAGIAHLHSKGILHRDVKPQNLLLTRSDAIGRNGESPSSSTTPAPPPRLLVADFGTAALLSDVSLADRTGGTGTLEYMAPELFDTVSSSTHSPLTPGTLPSGGGGEGRTSASSTSAAADAKYLFATSKASDVWSLGMILHYLACDGTLPPTLSDGSVILNVQEHSPVDRPIEMVELIRAMLHRDPNMRPTCLDILSASSVQKILKLFERDDYAGHELRPSLRRTESTARASSTAVTRRASPVPGSAQYSNTPMARTPPKSCSPVPTLLVSANVQTDVSSDDWDLFVHWKASQAHQSLHSE